VRFEESSLEAKKVLQDVRDEYFPDLVNINILMLFDTKKRISGGKVVLGRIQKTNDLLRHLTIEDSRDDEGYDFIIYLDQKIFTNIEKDDKIRLIRHELRHILYDTESEKNPFKIAPHDIEDFKIELELNKDDIDWADRVASLGEALYSQESDQERD